MEGAATIERETAGGRTSTTAVLEPLAGPATVEQTVERLARAVKSGLLEPGRRLPPEREMAEQFGLAPSALRRALATLVESGYLEPGSGRGAGILVAERPPACAGAPRAVATELREVLDHRVAVETGVCVLAAERAGAEDFERLSRCVDATGCDESFDDFRRADARFHLALAAAARSARLEAAMADVHERMTELLALIPHPETVRTRSSAQHRRLVSVLARRDGATAVRLMREHLSATEHLLIGLLPPDSLAEGPAPDRRRRA